jgi:uncharacterized Zn finger protein (UPF0148 family)
MSDQACPNCGAPLPQEVGQHAVVPSAGVVECPNCGATVTLAKAEAGDTGESVPVRGGEPESFSGHETVEGVMEEIDEKEQP